MSEKTCSFVLLRGKNEGQKCGRKITTEGNELCRVHNMRNEETGCDFELTRGLKKGEKCGKPIKNGKYCYAHCPELEYKKCPYVITRGERTGQICSRRCNKNSDLCSIHNKSDNLILN
jgi:hypothetical protein